MMKKKGRLMLVVACLLTSCTDVDLCYEAEHPHLTSVDFDFDWSQIDSGTLPDSMYIVGTRVINLWKTALGISPLTGQGTYVHTSLAELEGTAAHTFRLKSGEYKFVAFNREVDELDYTSVEDYFVQPDMPMQDLYLSYKLYSREDPGLRFIIPDWTDQNPYRGSKSYMQPSLHLLCYDTLSVRRLRPNQQKRLTFIPHALTQHIDIYFDIQKKLAGQGFVVDSVFAEMSGIPVKIDLSTGYMDITSTAKSMFPCMITPDGMTNTKVTAHAILDVPTIVSSASNSIYTGPGIMQIIIFTTLVYQPDYSEKPVTMHKQFQGKINLYHTLKEADLVKYTDDGLHVTRNGDRRALHINASLVIDGQKIIEASDDYGGIDVWKHVDLHPIIVDI